MENNNINIVEYAKSYINKYKNRSVTNDKKLLHHILENLFKCNYVVVNNNIIIHSSIKYNKIIGKEVPVELKSMISNADVFKRSSIQLAPRKYFQGYVFGMNCSKNKKNNTYLIINFNLERMSQEVLPIIYNLKKYVYLY